MDANLMDVTTLASKALECDRVGRILEAQYLYKEASNVLLKILSAEENPVKKKALYERIDQYLVRAEQILNWVKNQPIGGEVEKHISIEADSTGHTYETLFGEYLNDDVWEIFLEEPYVVDENHFQNLMVFFELVVRKCPNMKYLCLVTRPCKKVDSSQSSTLEHMQMDFKRYNKTLDVIYDEAKHDRKILLSTGSYTGYIIKIGFGLDYLKRRSPTYTLGLYDYHFRKCKQTDMDIFRIKQ